LTLAERELARADAELDALAAPGRASSDAAREHPADQGPGSQPRRRAPSPTDCATVCKAFASLTRARDAICRIDGSGGARCAHANAIVERHATSRETCRCAE
jgi:hypothetical protein